MTKNTINIPSTKSKSANKNGVRYGDTVKWIAPKEQVTLIGIVTVFYDNSVMVEIINGGDYPELDLPDKTVVNHKRYTKVN